MPNIVSIPLSFTIIGDGVSLTAIVSVDETPTAVTLGQVRDSAGMDISSNVASTVLTGSTVTLTFNAAFTGAIFVSISLAYPSTRSNVVVSNFPTTQSVSGTFFQATQPISIAAMPSTPVTGSFWQTTQPVSGTFWQATQPISGAVSFTVPQHVIIDSATLGTVAVTGAFFQDTQPVSITSMPTTPVTGAFWQATQPVSIATMPTTPVTGTFWQGTQPISGAISFTAPQHVILDSEAQSDSSGSLYTNAEGRKATYSAFAAFVPTAAGDVAVLPGSATKTVRVLRVEFSCSTSGTANMQTIQLVKRSTADTGGTSTATVAVPHDSLFPAASAAPRSYTAAPTLGTLVGPVRGQRASDLTSLSSGTNYLTAWTFGTEPGGSAIVLRGVAEQLCLVIASVPSVQTVTALFTWTEE